MKRTIVALLIFFGISLWVSWGIAALMWAAGMLANEAGRNILAILFPLGPLVAALVVQAWLRLPFTALSFGLDVTLTRWLPMAWFIPIAMALIVLVIELALPGVTHSFSASAHLPALPADATPEMKAQYDAAKSVSPVLAFVGQLAFASFFAALFLSIVMLAEEIGWRGQLLRILAVFGFWPSVLLTGVLVGTWSLPLVLAGDLYPNAPKEGLFLVVLYTIALAPLAAFLRLASGTVLAAAVFHGTLLTLTRFINLFRLTGNDLLVGVPGVVGVLVIVVADLIIVLPRWKQADAALRELIV